MRTPTALLFFLCCLFAGAATNTRYTVHRVPSPPKIDGILDDNAWTHVPAKTGFVYLNQRDTFVAPPWQTTFRVAWDNRAVYYAVEAAEPHVDEHFATARARDTGKPNWQYPLIELFLAPPSRDGHRYLQFAVDLLGRTLCLQAPFAAPPEEYAHPRWPEIEMDWQAAVKRGRAAFTAEVAIPFAALDATPRATDAWGAQIGRHGTWEHEGLHWKIAKWSQWIPMPSARWRQVTEHGALVFSDEILVPDRENVGKRTRRNNADYYAWKAARGGAMDAMDECLARIQGENLLIGAEYRVFGRPTRALPPADPRNWTECWNTGWTDNPETVECTWTRPVTFDCYTVAWLGDHCPGTDFSLEVHDGERWQLADDVRDNQLSVNCSIIAPVTTDRIRLTVFDAKPDRRHLVIKGFGLYHVAGGMTE